MKKKKTKIKIKEKPEQSNDLITVILLCDSPGYRMKSYGPIPLIQIGNNKLIDIQISSIKQCFTNFEIIICTGFDSEKTCKYIRNKYNNLNIRIVENQIFAQSNSNEGARLSLNNTLNNKILICDGNLLLNSKSLGLINCDHTCVLLEKSPCENLDIGININENNEAQYFSFGAYKTWSEVIYINSQYNVELFRKIVSTQEKTKFMFESINELLKNDVVIKGIDNKYPLQKINNIKTYHSVKGKT